MVHRTKDLSSPPAALMDSKWDSLKALVIVEKDAHDAKTSCYRVCTLEALTKLYKDKCAYCERDRGDEVEIDHYRPRKSRSNIKDPQYNQTGYYWLTYEWSNLIPLCSRCNNYKSNKFPLAGWNNLQRINSHINSAAIPGFDAYSISWLNSYERPLLINPEFEPNPEKHVIYTRSGSIIPKTDEGEETINICNLNRKDLRRIRLSIRQDYVDEIKDAFDDFEANRDVSELKGALKTIFRAIKLNCHIDKPYSLFHVYIYTYFSYFIDDKLPVNLRGQALKYFNEFKSKHALQRT